MKLFTPVHKRIGLQLITKQVCVSTWLGGDTPLTIQRIGNNRLRMFGDFIRNIECSHDAQMKRNLLLVSTLDDQGYNFNSVNGTLKVCKGFMIFMKGKCII